jgi:hypothetical protein
VTRSSSSARHVGLGNSTVLHAEERDVDAVLQRKGVVVELHGFRAGVAPTPATMFVPLLSGGFPDARRAVAMRVGVATAAVYVEGPQFVLEGGPGGTIEGREVGIIAQALQLEERVGVGLAKVTAVPRTSRGMLEDQGGGIGRGDKGAEGQEPHA